jgi:hypothetical protein
MCLHVCKCVCILRIIYHTGVSLDKCPQRRATGGMITSSCVCIYQLHHHLSSCVFMCVYISYIITCLHVSSCVCMYLYIAYISYRRLSGQMSPKAGNGRDDRIFMCVYIIQASLDKCPPTLLEDKQGLF